MENMHQDHNPTEQVVDNHGASHIGRLHQNHKSMEPFSILYAVSFLANAVASVYNAKKSREITLELEERRVKEKKVNDADAHNRVMEIKDVDFKNELIKNELKSEFEKTQIWSKRGGWLKTVAPFATPPIVVFDTSIRNNTTKKDDVFSFNPMESLCHSFKQQVDNYFQHDLYITNVSKEFKSQAAVEAFYNDEMPNIPAVIVFGSFDGNYLFINAVYGGITIDQHIFNKQLKPEVLNKRPKNACLAKIPISVVSSAIETLNTNSEIQLAKEKIQNLIDLVANTSLQALIDCHYSIYQSAYIPLVGINSILEEANRLDILSDKLKESVQEHKSNMLDQRNRIQALRAGYIMDVYKNKLA